MFKSNMLVGAPLILFLWTGAYGCSQSVRVGTDGFEAQPTLTRTLHTQSSRFFLSQADISIAATESVDDLVRQLRPDWLRAGPTQRQGGDSQHAAIFVDQTFLGGLETLKLVQSAEAESVEYLTPMAARGRFGPTCACPGGAIVISRRSTPRS
jgi:hypothetical protein